LAKNNIVNEKIRADKLRVIDHDGENVGVISKNEALKKAKEKKLDLVLVAQNAKPPVAKIMDYGKYQYQQKKKQQGSQKAGEMKEIRISLNIEKHDLEVKRKKAESFLKDKNSVRINLQLHGREQAFTEQAKEKIKEFISDLSKYGKIDQDIKKEGRNITSILKPN
jgi:translation initiation factor IF-3